MNLATAMNLKFEKAVEQLPFPVVTHSNEFFQGISQALFFKNPFFGFTFLLMALCFNWQVFLFGIVSSLIAYIYSVETRTAKIIKQTGLMPINGLFFGVAFASLFHTSTAFYVCFFLGALAVPMITKALYEILQHWKLSPLIAPYILAVWTLWLCSNVIALSHDSVMWSVDKSAIWSAWAELPTWTRLIKSTFFGMGQIFFLRNSDFGLSLFLLITLFSPRRGIFFFAGTALATLTFYFITSGASSGGYGFYGYSAGLIGIGLASLPEEFKWRTIMLFCVLSLFVALASEQLCLTLGLPVLSVPYVMTFWFPILSRAPRLNVAWARTGVRGP